MLEGKLPEQALSAIKAHNELTGYKDESKLALALKASDALSGLIIAAALVMPDKRLASVRVESLKNKFKQKDLNLENFLKISLNALKEISNQLGL